MDSEQKLIESIYAATLDPSELQNTVDRWIERVGQAFSIEQPAEQEDLERHLRMAFELLERQGEALEEERATPVLEVRADGEVLKANAAAVASYGASNCHHLHQLPIDEYSLKEVLHEISRSRAPQNGSRLRILMAQRTDVQHRMLITIEPDGANFRLCSSEVVWTERLAELLRHSFDLTVAETEVVRLLSLGWNVDRVAEERGASVATVRSQIRAIYGKTEVSSLPELAHLIVGVGAATFSASDLPVSNTRTHGAAHPRAEDSVLMELPDGRTLEYSVFGATDGFPVLFLHDEICGDGWTDAAVRSLEKRKLKVIAPLRPLYGQTDPLPMGVNMGARQTAEDTICLLDALGFDRVVVLARTLGNSTALYLMAAQPERILGVVAVNPPLPMDDRIFAELNPLLRIMVYATTHSPALMRFVLRVRHAYLSRYGTERFLQTHFNHPSDRKLLENRAVRTAIEHGARITELTGFRGFESDLRIGETQTAESVAGLMRSPVTFVIGCHDQSNRKARIEAVIRAVANADMVELQDAGELVFYRHTEAILDLVQAYTRGAHPQN